VRGSTPERDWTKGSIFRNLLTLSWPTMVSNSLNMLGPTIDMIWVGRLGAASIAGVGIAGTVVMLAMGLRVGINTGTRALIARFVGAGDAELANHIAQQAFVISGIYAIVLAVIGVFFSEPILSLFGVEADVVTEGAAYMRILFIGAAAMSFRFMTEGIMQASGDTVTPMKVTILFRAIHIGLCPFLVFGWWIFPRMGVSGAAITNVISQSLGTGIGLWFLFTGRTRLQLTLRNFRFDPSTIWRIVKIGIPASVTSVQHTLSYLVLMWFIIPFGTPAIAAHTLIQRIENLFYMPVAGMGMAAGVLVGQNLGASQPGRAERTSWLASSLMTGFMVICSMAVLLWAENIVRIFSTEPDIVEIASVFLRIATAGYLTTGLFFTLSACLTGAGDTISVLVIVLLGLWGIQTPLAFFLPRITNLGVYGVQWAIVIAMITRAIAYTTYFRLGRWKRKKI